MIARRVQVAIVGGGPAGLALAHCLARYGVDTVLLERHGTAPSHPQATMVNARTTEILRGLGVLDEVLAESTTLETAARVRFLHTLAGPEFGRLELVESTDKLMRIAEQSPTLPVICPQNRLQNVLAARLAGSDSAELITGAEVTAVFADADGVDIGYEVDGAESQSFVADYVVLAEGLHGRMRHGVGIVPHTETTLGTLLDIHFRADLTELLRGAESVLAWLMNERVRGVLITVSPDTADWLLEVPLADLDPAAPSDPLSLLEAALGADVPVEILSTRTWTMGSTGVDRWRDASGRVLVIGDAAHTFPPTGGFGMNTGIQDAHNLAWKLAAVLQGWAAPGLLDSYEHERRPVAAFNRDQSERNAIAMREFGAAASGMIAAAGGTVTDELRAELAPGVGAQRPHFDFYGQALGFRYGAERVVADVVDYRPSADVGDRAPHVWLRAPDGALVSTLDLPDTGFTLVFGSENGETWRDAVGYVHLMNTVPVEAVAVRPDDAGSPAGYDLVDHTGRMREVYRLGDGGAVLIRPDGHIAAVLPGADPYNELIAAVIHATSVGVSRAADAPRAEVSA